MTDKDITPTVIFLIWIAALVIGGGTWAYVLFKASHLTMLKGLGL